LYHGQLSRSKDDKREENNAALERLIPDNRTIIDSEDSEEPSESDIWEHVYEYGDRHDD
jgi:hypothetical protein